MIELYKKAALVASTAVCAAAVPLRSSGGDAPSARVVVVLAGDVLPGVDGAHWYDRVLRQDGVRIFDGVAHLFRDADAVIVNLEGVLSTRTVKVSKQFTFRGDPSFARVLAGAGVRVATLGNNHAFDYGVPGFLDTRRTLQDAGIRCIGAGVNHAEAYTPAVLEINGIRLGFLGFSDVIAGPVAGPDSPGLAWVRDARWTGYVAEARRMVDALFVTFHWGVERSSCATDRQRTLGRAAVRAGADVVFGHHSHCVHDVEEYNGRPVYYGLGELAFYRSRREQILAVVTVERSTGGIVSITHRPVPIVIVNGRPRLDSVRVFPPVPVVRDAVFRSADVPSVSGGHVPAEIHEPDTGALPQPSGDHQVY